MTRVWVRRMHAAIIILIFPLWILSCSQGEKRAENKLISATHYFSPLNEFKSVTCEIQINLPESFKARKRQELIGEELKSWNNVFDGVEQHIYRWSTSGASCWVRGMRPLKRKLKPAEVQAQFLDSLDAQVKVASCVLLQAFYYNSPFKDLRLDDYDVSVADDMSEADLALISYNKKSEIRWNEKTKTLRSVTASGEKLLAQYSDGPHQPLLQRASIDSSGRTLSVEDLRYQQPSQQKRQLVAELLVALKSGEASAVPQAGLQFRHCVARISTPQPSPQMN